MTELGGESSSAGSHCSVCCCRRFSYCYIYVCVCVCVRESVGRQRQLSPTQRTVDAAVNASADPTAMPAASEAVVLPVFVCCCITRRPRPPHMMLLLLLLCRVYGWMDILSTTGLYRLSRLYLEYANRSIVGGACVVV